MRIKYLKVPVIETIFGLVLRGGCELILDCARRVAHLESHIGLVESKVGLVPSGGGLKEIIAAAIHQANPLQNKNYFQWLLSPLLSCYRFYSFSICQ